VKVRDLIRQVESAGDSTWGACVTGLSGVISTGDSLEEVASLIREAVEFHIEGLKADDLGAALRLASGLATLKPARLKNGLVIQFQGPPAAWFTAVGLKDLSRPDPRRQRPPAVPCPPHHP
jgi:predicted RNase H-like HicB family nuclease